MRAALKHKEYREGLQALERAAAAMQGDVNSSTLSSTRAFQLPVAPSLVRIASASATEIEGAKAKVAAERAPEWVAAERAAEERAAEWAAEERAAAGMAGEVTPRRRRPAEERAAAERAAAERAAVAVAAATAETSAAAATSVAESSDPRLEAPMTARLEAPTTARLEALLAMVAAEAAWDGRLKGTTRADAARVLADQGGHVGRAFHEIRLDPAARARVRPSLYAGERTSIAEREAARKAASESETAVNAVINAAAEEAAAEQAGAAKETGAMQAATLKGSDKAAWSVKSASPKGSRSSRLISFMRNADESTFV